MKKLLSVVAIGVCISVSGIMQMERQKKQTKNQERFTKGKQGGWKRGLLILWQGKPRKKLAYFKNWRPRRAFFLLAKGIIIGEEPGRKPFKEDLLGNYSD